MLFNDSISKKKSFFKKSFINILLKQTVNLLLGKRTVKHLLKQTINVQHVHQKYNLLQLCLKFQKTYLIVFWCSYDWIAYTMKWKYPSLNNRIISHPKWSMFFW